MRELVRKNGVKHSILMQTKNHVVIMPDADVDRTIKEIINEGFEKTGQKFMDHSILIFVGKSKEWVDKFVK